MPKIVIAPQEFKGSLTAIEIARAIEVGVLRAIPDAATVLAPVADGGDGTLQALVDSSGGRIESATVTGPLGRRRRGRMGRARRRKDGCNRNGEVLGLWPLLNSMPVTPAKRQPKALETSSSRRSTPNSRISSSGSEAAPPTTAALA